MDRILSLVSLAPDWIADWVGDLFDGPFWKVMGGLVILTLSLFSFVAAPTAGRDKIKLVALFGALGLAAFDLFWPLERGFPLG